MPQIFFDDCQATRTGTGPGIGDWDLVLGLGTGIGNWDWVLGMGMGIIIGNGKWENGNGK